MSGNFFSSRGLVGVSVGVEYGDLGCRWGDLRVGGVDISESVCFTGVRISGGSLLWSAFDGTSRSKGSILDRCWPLVGPEARRRWKLLTCRGCRDDLSFWRPR